MSPEPCRGKRVRVWLGCSFFSPVGGDRPCQTQAMNAGAAWSSVSCPWALTWGTRPRCSCHIPHLHPRRPLSS